MLVIILLSWPAVNSLCRESRVSAHRGYRAVDEVLEVLLEPHEVQERAPFPERHEEVEVAVLSALTLAREPNTRTFRAP
jgi:hypothetical protein